MRPPSRPVAVLALAVLPACMPRPSQAAGRAPRDLAPHAARHEAASVADRRHLHAAPELSLREHATRRYVVDALAGIPGVELVDGDWGTGVVAVLRGARPGAVVAWRADFDALPVTEATGLPFASTRRDTLAGSETGVMHACGHDLHTAIALGAMRILSEVRSELPGTVLFIGEPAEEIGAGAPALLEAGLFHDGRRPCAVLALHVHPTIPFGQVGSCPGASTANVDGFELRVKGRGGHAAYPHQAVDPVALAARMVLALEAIPGREIDVNRPCVITVGSIHGGTTENVIPAEVTLEATVRSHDEATRLALRERVERTVKGLAASAGAPEPELRYYLGTPAGWNDPGLVAECREVFRRVVGAENDITYAPPMGGEDFSYYSREVPGFQFRLGVGRPDRGMTIHSGDFDPDERAVALGMRLAAELVRDQLERRERDACAGATARPGAAGAAPAPAPGPERGLQCAP